MDTVKEGEGGTNWESGIETSTLPNAKLDSQWHLLYDAGSSNPVLWNNLEGWDGGRENQEGGDIGILNYGKFMLIYVRNPHNTVKQLSSN